jgi:hypothetical protein
VSLTVLFDESMRRPLYFGAAVGHEGSSTRQVDQLVRRHRLPGQIRFHTKNESSQRRRAFITECLECGLVRAWVYVAQFPTNQARRAIVQALVTDAAKNQTGRLVFETGDPARDLRDRQETDRTLRQLDYDLAYSHERPGSYAGLEIADAVAWAYGAGGGWQTLVRPMIEFVRDLGP